MCSDPELAPGSDESEQSRASSDLLLDRQMFAEVSDALICADACEHKHGPQIGVGLFCSGGKRESARALTWSLNEIVVRDRRGLCT